MGLREPPAHDVHADRGASFTDFGGWNMPVEFDGIRIEHEAVRESVGIFDVSHMGEIEVSGPDATELLQRLTTNDVSALEPGRAHYSCITDEDGIIIDDTMVYRLPETETEPAYLFIPNAGHDEEAYDRWVEHRDEWDLDASVENTTEEWAMFAIQGPDAAELLAEAAGEWTGELSFLEADEGTIDGIDCLIARTGYTGEDGFEVLCPPDAAETVFEAFDCQPCGLGARDTLRTEMGFLLSGQDFDPEDEPRTPLEAGVGFVVALDTEFVGRDALAAQQEAGVEERFIGFELLDRGVPRHGYPVVDDDGEPIGTVTSGTMSPTLGEPIGLGYLDSDVDAGSEVAIEIRGNEKRARVTEPPFIER